MPSPTVDTSFGRYFITSYMANIASIDPPGELMNSRMSRCPSCAARSRSWEQTRLASSSSISAPMKTMRCASSRWNTASAAAVSGTSVTRARGSYVGKDIRTS
jgi:hypothetical protein